MLNLRIKTAIVIMLSFSLLFVFNASALVQEKPALKENDLIKLEEVQKSIENLNVTETVDNSIKVTQILDMRKISELAGQNDDYDKILIEGIYKKLGYTDNQINCIPDKDKKVILKAESIDSNQSYAYMDSDKNINIITKEEFLSRKEKAEKKQSLINSSSFASDSSNLVTLSSNSYTETESDPCFIISVSIAKISNNEYFLSSTWSCYNNPVYYKTDIYGMTHYGLIKKQNTFYSNYTYTRVITEQNQKDRYEYVSDPHYWVGDNESPAGQSVNMKLEGPETISANQPISISYTKDRQAYMSYYATLAETTTYAISCTATYLHTYSSISASLGLSFSITGFAPSITPSVSTGFADPLSVSVPKLLQDFS